MNGGRGCISVFRDELRVALFRGADSHIRYPIDIYNIMKEMGYTQEPRTIFTSGKRSRTSAFGIEFADVEEIQNFVGLLHKFKDKFGSECRVEIFPPQWLLCDMFPDRKFIRSEKKYMRDRRRREQERESRSISSSDSSERKKKYHKPDEIDLNEDLSSSDEEDSTRENEKNTE